VQLRLAVAVEVQVRLVLLEYHKLAVLAVLALLQALLAHQ
jgi:hypothetical protein